MLGSASSPIKHKHLYTYTYLEPPDGSSVGAPQGRTIR